MYCKKCGKEMDENMAFCPYCGAGQADGAAPGMDAGRYSPPAPADARSGGFAFLCFLFPLVGLILYLVWKDTIPLRARSCGKGAIIGVVLYVVFLILYIIIVVAIIAQAASAAAI